MPIKRHKVYPTIECVRFLLDYDPETGVFTWRKTMGGTAWRGTRAGSIANGYRRIRLGDAAYAAAHLAWFYVYGVWPPNDVDHINMCRDDNRIANLRLATRSQNIMNSRTRADCKSGLKGVRYVDGGWIARITKDGTKHYLGYFPTPEAAHAAYCDASKKMHGEFSRIG